MIPLSVLVISEQFLTDHDSITVSGSDPGAVFLVSLLCVVGGLAIFPDSTYEGCSIYEILVT